jgi:hypothetical protein
MILKFTRRSQSDANEPPELPIARSSASFSNVRGHRLRGSHDLIPQVELMPCGEAFRKRLDLERETVSFLPHEKIAEVLHGGILLTWEPGASIMLKLITDS